MPRRKLLRPPKIYEKCTPGLGARFLDELDATVSEIAAKPEMWSIVVEDLRRRTMRRFPFTIYYRVQEEELRILVVTHHSRHPDYWRNRLPEQGQVCLNTLSPSACISLSTPWR